MSTNQNGPDPNDKALTGIDPEWLRVVTEYESRIGLLPMSSGALEILMSFFDDLGADVMIAAIRKTAEDQPQRSYSYLTAILEAFIRAGVNSKEEAEQNILQFEEARKQWGEKKSPQNSGDDSGEVRWF